MFDHDKYFGLIDEYIRKYYVPDDFAVENCCMCDDEANEMEASIWKNVPAKTVERYIEGFDPDILGKTLMLYLKEKDLTTRQIYDRSFISRQIISSILNGKTKKPSQETMMRLAFAMELDLEESEKFMSMAGYTYANSSKRDLIFKAHAANKIFDLDSLNNVLIRYEENPLGDDHYFK